MMIMCKFTVHEPTAGSEREKHDDDDTYLEPSEDVGKGKLQAEMFSGKLPTHAHFVSGFSVPLPSAIVSRWLSAKLKTVRIFQLLQITVKC